MSKLVFDRGNFADFTSVSNIFIDEYMPKANGEFIKIYLHLLRLVHTGNENEELSISKIADKFHMLETDVIRALHYWSDQHLVSLSFDSAGTISGIRLESLSRNHYFVRKLKNSAAKKGPQIHTNIETLASAAGETSPAPVPENCGAVIPARKKYTAKEISAFNNDDRVKQLTFLAQTYLGKTLNSSDINSILYMLDGLNLDVDFIIYIMETCISSGHKSLSYIEKQAVEYTRKNISSEAEAKADQKMRNTVFKKIYEIFGLTSKAPVKKEISYVKKWTDELGFTDDIILEACHRTMEHTHTASFQYADKILLNWSGQNVTSLQDIEKLDSIHSKEMDKTYKTTAVHKVSRPKNAKAFQERVYDYSKLEKQIMESQDKKIKRLLSEQNSTTDFTGK